LIRADCQLSLVNHTPNSHHRTRAQRTTNGNAITSTSRIPVLIAFDATRRTARIKAGDETVGIRYQGGE